VLASGSTAAARPVPAIALAAGWRLREPHCLRAAARKAAFGRFSPTPFDATSAPHSRLSVSSSKTREHFFDIFSIEVMILRSKRYLFPLSKWIRKNQEIFTPVPQVVLGWMGNGRVRAATGGMRYG
jgi:hypothetical protein